MLGDDFLTLFHPERDFLGDERRLRDLLALEIFEGELFDTEVLLCELWLGVGCDTALHLDELSSTVNLLLGL